MTEDLFTFAERYPDAPGYRRAGPSQEAAASIRPVMSDLQHQVLAFVRDQGEEGATLHEIAAGTGISLQTVCARRREIELKGLVKDSGKRRLSPSKRAATVWVVC